MKAERRGRGGRNTHRAVSRCTAAQSCKTHGPLAQQRAKGERDTSKQATRGCTAPQEEADTRKAPCAEPEAPGGGGIVHTGGDSCSRCGAHTGSYMIAEKDHRIRPLFHVSKVRVHNNNGVAGGACGPPALPADCHIHHQVRSVERVVQHAVLSTAVVPGRGVSGERISATHRHSHADMELTPHMTQTKQHPATTNTVAHTSYAPWWTKSTASCRRSR